MRHFTKTHNDLKWLFPIARTKKEAEAIFDECESNAKYVADCAGIADKDRDFAIDCFMKGYSYALQMKSQEIIENAMENIYCTVFKVKFDAVHPDKRRKYFRFHRAKDLLTKLAYGPNKAVKKASEYFRKMFDNTGFDREAPLKEQLKVMW